MTIDALQAQVCSMCAAPVIDTVHAQEVAVYAQRALKRALSAERRLNNMYTHLHPLASVGIALKSASSAQTIQSVNAAMKASNTARTEHLKFAKVRGTRYPESEYLFRLGVRVSDAQALRVCQPESLSVRVSGPASVM
jgi:hypothetical protein